MEHVSTLCAISTVGIAATGFALGRVERALIEPTNLQRAPLPDPDTIPSFDAAPSRAFATAETQSPVNPNFPETRDNVAPFADQVEGGNVFRKTSFAGIRLRRRGQTLSIPPVRTEDNPPSSSHGRRPSSSWIRRLSFQPDKRFSLQSPDTLSFPEPVSPAFSRPPSQRRVPNKLVKRPKSQHSNASHFFAHTISSPSASGALRRPATSYQRSETSKHKAAQSLSFEPSLALGSLLEPPSGNDPWQPYMVSKPDTSSERLDRRFSASTKPRDPALRRIFPQTDVTPALVLATSIGKKDGTARGATLPTSPIEFRDPFKTDDAPPREPNTRSSETNTCQTPCEEARPKSPAGSAGPLDIRVFRNGSFTGPKRRAASTPLPGLANVEGAIWVSPRVPERRNITDPNVFRRPPTNTANGGLSSLYNSGIMGSQSQVLSPYRKEFDPNASTDGSALSSLYGSVGQCPKRHSIAASDPASTVIGSDDTRVFTSGDEYETDFMSDTAFDSIRTHITTDGSCFQSPRIETIFDRTVPLRTTIEPCQRSDGFRPSLPSTKSRGSDEEGRTIRTSSLTPVARILAEAHEEDSEISFPSDLSDDDDSQSMVASLPGDKTMHPLRHKFGALSLDTTGEQDQRLAKFSNRPTAEAHDTSSRANIFDWSEHPRPDREGSGPDGRPRTVHGKHGPGIRGSRATGRKPPSTLHYRSQSVPVAREPAIPNESRQSSGKFGTWGLGSKGVSEDWDSDFEFEDKDKDEGAMNENVNRNKDVNSRQSVIVPQAIMERQASLHGQFGHVQELTLLVEELKRLRHQASFLDIVHGPSNELWKEAEGIVDLATLDDDENNESPPRSPSSLTFSFDESEGESSQLNDPWKRISGDSWRASLSENSSLRPTTSVTEHTVLTKANSVLDLIYQQRLSHDPATMHSHLPRSKKLPFDTQSLRDLVVRASVVTRALKEVVRKAEGVPNGSEENTHPSHPPFSRIFEHPPHGDLSKFETSCIG
ncbi:uncharacterized protein DSM5745_11074 [Aspergillus mulundensis]|uniref:Uncharacterized protein n=1 Tax=Aspergillus mulundensis TaxID=1810919 RepID=A0A3D8QC77_9EURO|nr:Uncharacterized protein DSM5745_11074 [Aspergillus mulundensis]RDW59379.1 Uncharacterized protein DSM5745_11074 [Aspergillus mulundensis]